MQSQSWWRGCSSTLLRQLHTGGKNGHIRPLAPCSSRQKQQRAGSNRQQPWQWHTIRRGWARAQARRSSALQELQQLQQVEAESTSVASSLEWQPPLKIVLYPDPRLRSQNARIGTFDDDLRRFAEELLAVMYNASDGVGLAAPQVGVNIRLMVFNPTGVKGEEEFVLVNPRLIHTSRRKDVEEEGCLSFPKIYGDVERPMQIKIRAQDLSGKRLDVSFEGWQARIFQHEFDHLQGVLFHDRMNAKELSKVKGQLQAMEDAFQRAQPSVQIQRVA